MSDIVTIENIQYTNFRDQNTFDLILKLNINNSANQDYIQGIVSLNSTSDFLTVKESILFIGDIPSTSENSFYCVLNNVPLLYNYLNINDTDILNYTLNIKLISPNMNSPDSPIKVSLDESIKLNLKHKNFLSFQNEEVDVLSYQDSFKCFNSEEYAEYINKQKGTSTTENEVKDKILSILNNGLSCNNNDNQILTTANNETSMFNIKTNKQNILITLNKSKYALEPVLKNIFLSLQFENPHQVSAVSAQIFKYYNLPNFQAKIKVSPKIDKFTLFSDDSLKISIPLYEDEIIEPSVPNLLSYYLLVKFVEPEIEHNDSGNQYFDVREQKNLISQTLKSDMEGNLGLCQIPLKVAYY